MSKWVPAITDVGNDALNGLLSCQTLAFADARGCAGTVPEVALAAQNDLDGWTQGADITEVERGAGKVTAKLRFSAAEAAYTLHRIGIWVRVGDGQPVMVSIYQHDGSGVDIPSKAENPTFSFVYYAGLAIKNGQLVTLTVEPTAEQAARDDAAASAVRAAGSAAEAESAKVISEDARDKAAASEESARRDCEEVRRIQGALHLRRRVVFGTATDVEKLLPGDTLIITDESSLEHTTDYYDLLLEAQKSAAGVENTLEAMAVLSVVNTTNLRRTADGLLWTTDTIAEFRSKLTAFAVAAVAAGYVDADGNCIATWAQAQHWMIAGQLLTPLDAEAVDYPWRKAQPKTELDAIKERLGSVEAQLGQAADRANTLINGGNLT